MSSPSTLTLYVPTGRAAGRESTSPVRKSNCDPWRGHSIKWSSRKPSAREASSWVQVSSIARNSPSTLNTAMRFPPSSKARPSPAGRSAVEHARIQLTCEPDAHRSFGVSSRFDRRLKAVGGGLEHFQRKHGALYSRYGERLHTQFFEHV